MAQQTIINTKAFVINLDRRTDRLETLKVPFEYERFSATDGTTLDEIPKKMKGHIGCWDSHRRLLTKVLEDKLEQVIVMEDDVEFHPEFQERIDHYLNQLPDDWDLFYFGGWNIAEERKMYSERLDVAEKVLTTHAYMIRAKFIPILLEALNARKYKVDVVFCDALTKGKCFIANPVLAWQKAGYSDITRSNNTNGHLK